MMRQSVDAIATMPLIQYDEMKEAVTMMEQKKVYVHYAPSKEISCGRLVTGQGATIYNSTEELIKEWEAHNDELRDKMHDQKVTIQNLQRVISEKSMEIQLLKYQTKKTKSIWQRIGLRK